MLSDEELKEKSYRTEAQFERRRAFAEYGFTVMSKYIDRKCTSSNPLRMAHVLALGGTPSLVNHLGPCVSLTAWGLDKKGQHEDTERLCKQELYLQLPHLWDGSHVQHEREVGREV